MSIIQLENITKIYNRVVFSKLNLNIETGKFISILGPSGCGKSTLLRLISDLEKPTSGNISGVPQSKALVFQEANLLPWLSVRENIELPLKLKKAKPNTEVINFLLKNLKILNAADYLPHELSGGMKMRTSIARCLATDPELVLLDEPFSALDEQTRFEMQSLIRSIFTSSKKTFVLVTHSISESVFLSDEIIVMNGNGDIMFQEKYNFSTVRDSDLRSSSDYFNQVNRMQRIYNEAQK